MPRLTMRLLSSCAFAFTLLPSSASGQGDKITLEAREKWTNFAAESKVKLHFTVKVPRAFKGQAIWTFSDPGTKRTFPGGAGANEITAGPEKPVTVEIPLAMPSVKPGVVWKGQLLVAVHAAGQKEAEASYEKTIWIFPGDPFVERAKWFEGLKITLYDSDPKSKTAEALMNLPALKDLKSPFEQTSNVAGIADFKEGLLLVGEGVSFKDEAGLAEALAQAAGRGVTVLCLAPKDGAFPLPGADNGLPSPSSLTLRRQDIILKLDKHLDGAAWAPDNQVVARSLAVRTDDGKVIAEVQDGAKGWPWLQLDYPDKKSRLVLVGFPIIQRWQDGPTPRYLLARLLEHATELSASDPKVQKDDVK